MIRKIIITATLLFVSPFSFGFDLKSDLSAAQIWAQAEQLSGPPEAMAQRSLMFHKIYIDSEKLLPFALSVSHLTLAIERSLDFGSLDSLPWIIPYSQVLKRDMGIWRSALRDMNKDMFKRTYFAYMFARQTVESGQEPEVSESVKKVFLSIQSILPVMKRVHEARVKKEKINSYELLDHFETLVHWEHAELFQPQLETVFQGLHWIMKWNLRKIPGPNLEKYILHPLFDLRSSFNLQCFIDPEKKLQTADFMDSTQRITQARDFFMELNQINMDPADFCYNDDYYLSAFPKEFFTKKSEYLDGQTELLLSQKLKSLNFPNKISGIQHAIAEKHSATRLFNNLSSEALCQPEQFQFWKHYPSNLLKFPESILISHIDGVRGKWARLEMGVARNAIINRSYVELFLIHANRLKKINRKKMILPHSWLGSAAFGSFSVGKELLYGMYSIFSKKLGEDVLYRFEDGDLEKVKKFMNGYSGVFAQLPQFLKTLALANQAVFNDIFWQFMVSDICGPRTVIEMLAQSSKQSDRESIEAWIDIHDGAYKSGNLKLLRVEQELVLQPVLYDGVFAKYFSWRKIFNRYATAGAPGPLGQLLSFDDFSSEQKIENNLANLNSRMDWVNYLIENHAIYFWMKNNQGQLPEAFEDIIRVSDKIINYYKKY